MPKVTKISRDCIVCGDKIQIKVDEKGHYDKGYYFGKLKVLIKGTGKYEKVGTFKLFKKKFPVTKWTGKEKEHEYWECNLCYDAAMRENWLEKRIESYYGERCPDFEPNCPCCHAWFLYDKIAKGDYLRGTLRQSYDKSTNAVYIYIGRARKPKRGWLPSIAKETLELSDYINLDFDKHKNLVGIEILDASRRVPKCLRT